MSEARGLGCRLWSVGKLQRGQAISVQCLMLRYHLGDVCLCVCVCVASVFIYLSTYLSICVCVYIYIYMYVSRPFNLPVYLYICMGI